MKWNIKQLKILYHSRRNAIKINTKSKGDRENEQEKMQNVYCRYIKFAFWRLKPQIKEIKKKKKTKKKAAKKFYKNNLKKEANETIKRMSERMVKCLKYIERWNIDNAVNAVQQCIWQIKCIHIHVHTQRNTDAKI